MSASPRSRETCPSCGAEHAAGLGTCPACGAPAGGELPPLERVPGPVSHAVASRRWLGLPPGPLLLCVGFAALGAAVGVLAVGRWQSGILLLAVAAILLAALAQLTRTSGGSPRLDRAALLLADGRSRASTASEIWHARLEAILDRRRATAQLQALGRERGTLLSELGRAEWEGDRDAAGRARERLAEVEARRAGVERELETRQAQNESRIREARLPVDQTVMVSPSEPNPPYPPPGEADPPQPAQVPEPYPPPDEGTPPAPPPIPPPDPERD